VVVNASDPSYKGSIGRKMVVPGWPGQKARP
jgi:hypothetical protein